MMKLTRSAFQLFSKWCEMWSLSILSIQNWRNSRIILWSEIVSYRQIGIGHLKWTWTGFLTRLFFSSKATAVVSTSIRHSKPTAVPVTFRTLLLKGNTPSGNFDRFYHAFQIPEMRLFSTCQKTRFWNKCQQTRIIFHCAVQWMREEEKGK